jgi:hypothetical protein
MDEVDQAFKANCIATVVYLIIACLELVYTFINNNAGGFSSESSGEYEMSIILAARDNYLGHC